MMLQILLLFSICELNVLSFSPGHPPGRRGRATVPDSLPKPQQSPLQQPNFDFRTSSTSRWSGNVNVNVNVNGATPSPSVSTTLPSLAVTLGASTIASWCIIAWKGLMFHPVPQVAAGLCLRHNLFTVAQAVAFPLPVLTAAFLALHQSQTPESQSTTSSQINNRLCLGIAAASLWTAAAVFWGKTFCVGYDLFSNPIRFGCATIHCTTPAWALQKWKRSQEQASISRIVRGCVGSIFSLLAPKTDGVSAIDDPNGNNSDSVLYSASSLGLLLLAILPQLVSFPTATIPALLGKRLSRAASGFTFLGAVLAYCLKEASEGSGLQQNDNDAQLTTLRRGLAVGSIGHLGLVVTKVIGVDGGGLLLPGRGLWELYPSLVKAASGATLPMLVTFSILAFVCTSSSGKHKN